MFKENGITKKRRADNNNFEKILRIIGYDNTLESGVQELLEVARPKNFSGLLSHLAERAGMAVHYEVTFDDIVTLIELYNPGISSYDTTTAVIKAIQGGISYKTSYGNRSLEMHIDDEFFISKKIMLVTSPF